MKKILIIYNTKKPETLSFAMQAKKYLEQRDCEVVFKLKNKIDFIIILGGDGTFLLAVRNYIKLQKPFLGINFGHVGYLAEIEKQNAFKAFDNIIKNKFLIEKRLMLESQNILALNDIYLEKNSGVSLINFDIFINNLFVKNYSSNGIIISTPTGSTGYNLSAGGPVIKPNLSVISITPICARDYSARAIIISSQDKIKILFKNKICDAKIIFDGNIICDARENIFIKAANIYANIIRMPDINSYKL